MLRQRNNNNKEPKCIPLEKCLAKTVETENGKIAGINVENHCKIVGYVALELINRVPRWLRDSLFPKGSELIAAVHDIGKVSPTFQDKIYKKIGVLHNLISCDDRTIGYHWTVSQAAIENVPKYIPEIVGRHHGIIPQDISPANAGIYGGGKWQTTRQKLLDILKKEFNVEFPRLKDDLQAEVLSGLTVVADWIGSCSLFENSGSICKQKIDEALDIAGFILPKILHDLTFKNIFEFSPCDIQVKLFESVSGPGVYVLEAPMGLGKTEAALYAAYKMLSKGTAIGIYFALPTQLTSNKVYDRVNKFLENILDENDMHNHALLLHSNAWLKKTELGVDGAPGRSWFDSAKRGLLAPFAVGTIDQALMAVMNVKHSFVRTFGLAGKVVILDEVHSYDNYTGTILKELVAALRRLHCTVIILSATLTDKQRYSIVTDKELFLADKTHESKYPLISVYEGEKIKEIAVGEISDSSITAHRVDDENVAIEEALERAENKEQILWIENTVKEAQEIFCKLSARASGLNIECGLMHSRFIKKDRERNEEYWVNLFGKNARFKRAEKGRILVGTQVLEQSLDIDADFLVTRICPIDMFFQRMGRLWRHQDSIRPTNAYRNVWILAPRLEETIENENCFGDTSKVYSPYVLCRTLEVCQDVDNILIPNDIKRLIEKTYAERTETGRLNEYKLKLEEEREKLRRFALIGIGKIGKVLPESKATTRYSERESIEVLLIKEKKIIKDGVWIKFLDDTVIILSKCADSTVRRKLSADLLRNTVVVPEHLAPRIQLDNLTWLRNYVYLGGKYEDEYPFRVSIVSEAGNLKCLDGLNEDLAEKYKLSYDCRLGYKAVKK